MGEELKVQVSKVLLKVALKVQVSKVLLKVALRVQVPVRRYDKSLRIQFQYERWKGRPACQSCHDSSEQIQKYRNTKYENLQIQMTSGECGH